MSGCKRNSKNRLLLSASVIVGCVVASNAAVAQGDQIIVTATKRAESVQDVPIAITAIGGEVLESSGINDLSQLDKAVPGLNIGQSGSDVRPAIRGVPTVEIDLFNDPTIGFFVDGVYKGRTSQALAAFIDLERVEVLRGPQGTLQGRNTYGGSVSLITKKPEFDGFGGKLNAGYGNFNDFRLDGAVNIPLAETTALRIAGAFQESDGYVEVLPTRVSGGETAEDFNDNDQAYIRGSLLHEFSIGEIQVTASHWDRGGFGAGAFGYTVAGTLQDSMGNLDLGGTLDRVNPRNGSTAGPSDEGPYSVYRDTDLSRDIEETTVSGLITLDLGGVVLKSITGYSDFSVNRMNDDDFSDTAATALTLETATQSFSQEIQLISDYASPLQWVAGLYYYNEDGFEDFIFDIIGGGAFTFLQDVETNSYAAFVNFDYALSDNLTLTAGGRYTVDDKQFRFFFPNDAATPGTDEDESFDRFTWKAGVDYTPDDNNLLYVSASTGFRSGGFNNQFAGSPAYGPQNIRAIEAGWKNTFSDGAGTFNLSVFYNELKDVLASGFVEFGATNVIVRTNAGSSTSYGAEAELAYRFDFGLNIDANFAYLNAEYDTFAEPLRGEFAGVATGYTFTTDGLLDLSGNEVPVSPTYTASLGASYEMQLGDNATLTPEVRTYISDGYFLQAANFDGGIDGRDAGRQSSYTKTDLSLTLQTERFSLQGYVRNLENEAVLTAAIFGGQAALFQNYAPPRTYGVRAGVQF